MTELIPTPGSGGLGWIPDRHDPRDYRLTAAPGLTLPARFSLREHFGPARYQGNEGICTGFATAALLEAFESLHAGRQVTLSPRFLYTLAKQIDGHPGEEGSELRVLLKVAQELGCCLEASLPFHAREIVRRERLDAVADEAVAFKLRSYVRLTSIEDTRAALFVNGPVLAGVLVYDYWQSPHMLKGESLIRLPGAGERVAGGHAILLIGYDDTREVFEFRNSWSGYWGESGYGYLPYEYVTTCGGDLWTSVDLDPDPPAGVNVVKPSVWAPSQPAEPSTSSSGRLMDWLAR